MSDITAELLSSTELDAAVGSVPLYFGTSDKTHVHTQSTPAAEWTVRHNLGKYPCVSVVDSSGSEVVGSVDYPNENTCILRFAGAFSGRAFFN